MKLYWVKTGRLIKKLFPRFVWDVPNREKKIYLTFDDGPTPEITEWVLKILREYGAKATFFCIGNNIKQHPEIFRKVIAEGHTIGNHTYNHRNGWNTGNAAYRENWETTTEAIKEHYPDFDETKLFRPPYCRIKASQSAALRNAGYRIVMWDVLSADFDRSITPENCLENVIENTVEGSVIIFHDSVKAFPNLEHALPRALQYLKEKGFVFDAMR